MAVSRGIVGRNAAMAVDQYDVTGNHNEFKFKRDAAVVDVTTFGKRFSDDLAGIQKASLELKGFYDAGYDHLDQVINLRFGQDDDVLTLLAPSGWEDQAPAILMPSVITKYDVTAKLKGAVDIDSNYMARGAVDQGFLGLNPSNLLVGASGAGPIIDHSDFFPGGTNSGLAAQLHLVQVDGTTPSLTFKVQQSPATSPVWTDLATFTVATAATSQRIELPQGTFVNEMLRVIWANTGTGNTVRAAVGVSRGVHYT